MKTECNNLKKLPIWFLARQKRHKYTHTKTYRHTHTLKITQSGLENNFIDIKYNRKPDRQNLNSFIYILCTLIC